ncbi:putative binding protein precursor [Oxobacter pfennigii]|uniref:Putative binding protein n=1 Tax=Oxobacter pfennigii TaxID=36849 RepID=A0A0P8WKP6_9CLOT|nr:putative binding protein precursor [Oxobacter pfennigii]
MKKLVRLLLSLMLVLSLIGCGAKPVPSQSTPPVTETPKVTEALKSGLAGHTLSIYCGAGMTKPFEEIAKLFQDESGCAMEVTYGNAAQIQTQINTSKEGDLFIAGSADELQPVKDAVTQSTDLVKHIPVLAVKSGNPLGITGLNDLVKEGVRVVLGDAESTPIGKIANKALTDSGILDKVDVIARTATAPEIFNALKMDQCDAIIVWKENAGGDGVEIVNTPDMGKYIKTVPAASLSYSDDAEALSVFLEFLDTEDAKAIWTKYGYELMN